MAQRERHGELFAPKAQNTETQRARNGEKEERQSERERERERERLNLGNTLIRKSGVPPTVSQRKRERKRLLGQHGLGK